jgi:hypothetical protein
MVVKQKRGDQANGRHWELWEDQVVRFLVNGGTTGRGWYEIERMYRGAVSREALLYFLETLQLEGKVDRFQVPSASGKGTPKTVWRATTKIVES